MALSVGVLGLSYCGSTALNTILDGLDGVTGAGETHWILDQPGRVCKFCGSAPCPVWTDSLLAELRTERPGRQWYQRCRPGIDTRVLVATDKSPNLYHRLGWPDQIILLYRHPLPWVASWVRSMRRRGEPDDPVTAGAIWARFHGRLLDDIEGGHLRERWISGGMKHPEVVSWQRVREAPERQLPALASLLGAQWDAAALEFGVHHQIGGNKIRAPGLQLGPDDAWKDIITPQDAARIAEETAGTLEALDREALC